MSNFEKVIGYETIKSELMQICDMLKNREIYSNLGAKLPKNDTEAIPEITVITE